MLAEKVMTYSNLDDYLSFNFHLLMLYDSNTTKQWNSVFIQLREMVPNEDMTWIATLRTLLAYGSLIFSGFQAPQKIFAGRR